MAEVKNHMPLKLLPLSFYRNSTQIVARKLLGKLLVRPITRRRLIGRIVEVEAYLANSDPASHAARGKTKSNAAMFGPAGRAYVYPIHSNHCFNVVTGADGTGTAVLIRALEPVNGIDVMQEQRNREKSLELTRGPGRLCQAFAIDRQLDHWNLTKGRQLWVDDDGIRFADKDISTSIRIGVSSGTQLPLRFLLRDCPYVSGNRRLNH